MQSAWFCQSVLTPCGAKLERGICKWSKEMVDLVGIEPNRSLITDKIVDSKDAKSSRRCRNSISARQLQDKFSKLSSTSLALDSQTSRSLTCDTRII